MPPSFNLQLDTRPPVVTWGPVTDPNAGEDMSVLYALSEPALDHATITLIDGRELPMVDLGGMLTVHLPDDAPDGQAVVRAYVVDDVLNAATRTLAVVISGVPFVPPPPPVPQTGGGLPGTRPVQPVLIRTATEGHTSTGPDRIRVRQVEHTSARPRSVYRGPGQRLVRGRPSRAQTASAARLAVTAIRVDSVAATGGAVALWKRPEGPGAEEDLILLGLL